MADIKLGQTVETDTRQQGVVKYIGEVASKAGTFIGLELPTPTGKNDGSVYGERYFRCAPQHGLFVPKNKIVRVVPQPAPKPTSKPAPKPGTKPAPKPAAPRPAPPKAAAPKPRPSSIGSAKPLSQPASRLSTLGAAKPSTQLTAQPKRQSIAGPPTHTALRPTRKPSISASTYSQPPIRPSQSATRSTPPTATSSTTTKSSKDPNVQALETRIRHLEKQIVDYQERLAEAEQTKADRDRFEGLIKKLQAKCQAFHQELADLKAASSQQAAEINTFMKAQEELELDMESATIDKEMAEERAEQFKAERDALELDMEQKDMEIDILKDEVKLLTQDLPEDEKSAAALWKVETENERLREAIIKLRDIRNEDKREDAAMIKELQAQLEPLDAIQTENALLKDQIVTLQAANANLQEQVDAANEWEDMIEDISAQNQHLKEQHAAQAAEIQDLRLDLEVSNELEEQRVEQVKEYQAELEARDLQDAERDRREAEKDAALAERDLLVSKFRDVIMDMQSKLMDVEASKTISEEQMHDSSTRFREVMDLNRRLRIAAVSTTTKTINTELTKLSAKEATEELDILKCYLPESSREYMTDSLRAYFRAKKIGFKASLIASLLSTTDLAVVDGPEQALSDLLRFDAAAHLQFIQAYSLEFSRTIGSCSLEHFKTVSYTYSELLPVERSIERCMDAFKKDDLNFTEIAEWTRGSYQTMQAISGVHEDIFSLRPDNRLILHVSIMKTSLESIRSSFDAVKLCVQRLEIIDVDTVDGKNTIIESLTKPANAARETFASAAKLVQILVTLQNDGLYPEFPAGVSEVTERSERLVQTAGTLRDFAEMSITGLLSSGDTASGTLVASTVASTLDSEINPQSVVSLLKDLRTQFTQWQEFASVLMNNVEIERQPAPWVLKAQEIEEAKRRSIDAEKRLQLLTTEHHATLLQIREREEVIDTKELEIEHLRAKHREATSKASDLEQLKGALDNAKVELDKSRREVATQRAEILRLQEQAEYPPLPEPPVIRSPTTDKVIQPIGEQALPKSTTPSGFLTLVQALSDENHWLRRRENSEMFGHNLQAIFTKMRKEQLAQARTESRHREARADDMLGMSMSMLESPIMVTPQRTTDMDSDFLNDDWTPDWKSTPTRRGMTRVAPASGRRSPIELAPLQTSLHWQPAAAAPVASVAALEDFSFVDLSPIAEEFESERTEALEGFSQIDVSGH